MVAPEAAAVTAAWSVLYLALELVPTISAPLGGVVTAKTKGTKSEMRLIVDKRIVLNVGQP